MKRVTPRTSAIIQDTLALILAGGQGERLYPLTKHRAKPAVPFGGIYRIIDFALSNCINSQLKRICVLTQYKSDSLDRHIRLGWNIFSYERSEFIFTIPPQFRASEKWYQGTADAVYQNIYTIERESPDYVIILCGDHIYKMDYSQLLDFHVAAGADVKFRQRSSRSRLQVIWECWKSTTISVLSALTKNRPIPNRWWIIRNSFWHRWEFTCSKLQC